MVIADTFRFMLGRWQLTRLIEDRRTETRGVFQGVATITEVPSDSSRGICARYEEAGELHFGAHLGHAARTLQYVRLADGAVAVYFADGLPFVDLDLRYGSWQSDHRCGDDRYEIVTIVPSSTAVEEHWKVRGPTKDYEASTTLVRLA